jgi:hypothetical protein
VLRVTALEGRYRALDLVEGSGRLRRPGLHPWFYGTPSAPCKAAVS